MSVNRYYEKELVALRTLGQEFAENNPALAPFFNTPGKDPDVERILEGVAFLTGRLREKLDDELPEITYALFNLLWPNYLRPLPACSVIQFLPPRGLSGPAVIPREFTVRSEPVNGTPCLFRTAYETEVLPLELVDLAFATGDGEAVMLLRFRSEEVPLIQLTPQRLRVFLTGETTIVHTLYYLLMRKLRRLRVHAFDSDLRELRLAEQEPRIRPVGFAQDEVVYPCPPNSFAGYRILQEYFCFPEKFHFLDIELGDALSEERLSRVEGCQEFELQCVLESLPPNFESYSQNNIRLFCTPVVNLFPRSASPLTWDHRQTEYRIVPDPRYPYHYAVHSVSHVESWGAANRQHRVYQPFESFEHRRNGGKAAYYRLRVQPSPSDESVETYISLVAEDDGPLPQDATISMDLMCTNRMLPLQLGVGDIRHPQDTGDAAIPFKNITPVTPPFAPPLEGDTLWRLLSNMALNYLPLTNINALRGIVATYDFRALHDRRRARVLEKVLEGMRDIRMRETDRIYRGLPLRGAVTELTLDQRGFSCEGDMFLFASALNEFLALYATVNSFHQLVVREEKSGERYVWPPRLGTLTL